MESPTVIDERAPSFPHRHKILFGLVATMGFLVFAAFNVWVYQYSRSGKAPSPAAIWQAVTASRTGFGVSKDDSFAPALKGDTLPKQGVTFRDSDTRAATPTPTPRPTGPGSYACDEYGICNIYEDAKRVGCPKTYADPQCLNECGDKTVRCPKPK